MDLQATPVGWVPVPIHEGQLVRWKRGGSFDIISGHTWEQVGVNAGNANGLRGGVGGYHVAVDLSTLTKDLVSCIDNVVNALRSYHTASLRVTPRDNLLDTFTSGTSPEGACLTRREIEAGQVAATWRWWCRRSWCCTRYTTL